jgi:predicted ATPase/class 3 adenylate cyclase
MPELPTGTVTFLLTDIEGSTRLWEAHPEAMRPALVRHDALIGATVRAHGGTVIRSRGEGDSLFAVFARATDAVAAAGAAQRQLQAEPWPTPTPLRVRMALHTGEANLREGDYYGSAVNRCARLRAAAHGGQVLLSQATQELVRDQLPAGAALRDLGERRLKDLIRPERVFQLLHPDLPQEFPPLVTLDLRPHHLPAQPNPLLGRESELEAVCRLFRREEVRLITLTGPGGTGKTRLGLQVAADLLEDFRDGAFFVDLAPISDPALVAATIAQVLGVREAEGQPLTESLKAHLRSRRLLMLLDNFEQVVAAASVVAELLAAAPQLKALVTSRVVLQLRGEHEFTVSPLGDDAAVELFVERARAMRPDFAVTEENAPVMAAICQRLEGLPLAIELAVGRLKLFPPRVLLSRLEKRLPLLTGGARDLPARQQTLRSAIAWSYDLLDEPEQKLLRRLSVFAGGFSLEAAEAVCNPGNDLKLEVVDGLASLIDKSLLGQAAGPDPGTEDEAQFTMLETIREFGLECLAQSGEAEAIRRQHALFFLTLAERECDRQERLQRERGNLRVALGWVLECGEAELGFRFAAALTGFWLWCGPTSEGREYLRRLLALLTTPTLLEARAHTLDSAGTLAWFSGDYGAARGFYEESLAICQELGQKDRAGSCHLQLGSIARQHGDYERARTHYEQSLVIARESGNQGVLAPTLDGLGCVARSMGDLAKAAALFRESLVAFRELSEPGWIAGVLVNLAKVANAQGDQKAMQEFREESMALSRENEWEIANISMDQGHLLLEVGDYTAARSRFEEGLTARRAVQGASWVAWALLEVGHAAWLQGEDGTARSHAVEALRSFQELGHKTGILAALESLAVAELAQEPPGPGPHNAPPAPPARKAGSERAARLAATAAAHRRALKLLGPHHWIRPKERVEEAVRAASLEQGFAAAWAEGRAMPLEQAIAYALEESGGGDREE